MSWQSWQSQRCIKLGAALYIKLVLFSLVWYITFHISNSVHQVRVIMFGTSDCISNIELHNRCNRVPASQLSLVHQLNYLDLYILMSGLCHVYFMNISRSHVSKGLSCDFIYHSFIDPVWKKDNAISTCIETLPVYCFIWMECDHVYDIVQLLLWGTRICPFSWNRIVYWWMLLWSHHTDWIPSWPELPDHHNSSIGLVHGLSSQNNENHHNIGQIWHMFPRACYQHWICIWSLYPILTYDS
jgi:hypothetical protein